MTWSSCGKIDNWLITRQKRRQLFTSFVTQLLSSSMPFLVYFLMVISVSIARALSSLGPSNLMGGDQDALTDFIAEYLDEPEETSEGKPH